jgi:polysaccharide deacetylase family protein (PEP-CTERM system associated)
LGVDKTTGARSTTPHLFTVDVEDYFQVSALEAVVSREDWTRLPSRVERNVAVLLDEMASAGAVGTFFILGWVAKHHAEVVREIARRGHEVASHGFWHRRVLTLTPDQFRADLQDSKRALEDVIGSQVTGYRAPSFSVVQGTEWAFDVLLEEGFQYDSSIFPIRRRGYGYPGAPKRPYAIRRSSGTLYEFPLATTSFAGLTLPAAGGGYLRLLPAALTRRAFREASARSVAATFYVHPWEIDPEQPRFPVNALTRLRHYRGLSHMLQRIRALLAEFEFTSIASYLQRQSSTGRMPAVETARG